MSKTTLILALAVLAMPASLAAISTNETATPEPSYDLPCADTPLFVDECGDAMSGSLAFAGSSGVVLGPGLLNNAGGGLQYGGNRVCNENFAPGNCGDITGVAGAPGSGITGGATSGAATLGIDPSVVQRHLNHKVGGFPPGGPKAVGQVCANLVTESITASGPGRILVFYSVRSQIAHTVGTYDTAIFQVSPNAATACADENPANQASHNVATSLPSDLYEATAGGTTSRQVFSAGTYTEYLNGGMQNGWQTPGDRATAAVLRLLFVPDLP